MIHSFLSGLLLGSLFLAYISIQLLALLIIYGILVLLRSIFQLAMSSVKGVQALLLKLKDAR